MGEPASIRFIPAPASSTIAKRLDSLFAPAAPTRFAAIDVSEHVGHEIVLTLEERRLDILEEIDGPMFKHGLQEFHRKSLLVPTRDALKPDRRFLEERYARLGRAS